MPTYYGPQPPPRNVSNLRLFWIIWCCIWSFIWFWIGFATLFVGWVMIPVSLLCILIPIGKGPRPVAYHVPDNPRQLPTPPAGNVRIDGPAYDEAYQRWQRDQGPGVG
jgi:hypothetical protein